MTITPATPRGHRRPRWVPRVAVGAALTAAVSFGVAGVVGTSPAAAAVGLEPFGDCDALAAWSRPVIEPLVTAYGLGGGGMVAYDAVSRGTAESLALPAPAMAAGDAAASESASAAGAVGPGATGTNVQEAGVDEPDVAKTDGSLLVTTFDGELVVADVSGGEPARLGSVEIPDLGYEGWAATGEVLLVGDRAVVLGTSSYTPGAPPPAQGGPTDPGLTDSMTVPEPAPAPDDGDDGTSGSTGLTRGDLPSPVEPDAPVVPYVPSVQTATVTVVDLTDPTAPQVLTSTEIEGRYVSARESGGVVRLVVSSTPVLPFVSSTSTEYGPDGQVVDDAALQANLDVLSSASGEDLVPHVVERAADGTVTGRTPAVDCAAVSHPSEAAGAGTITVATLDIASTTTGSDPVVDTVGVSADGDVVYASTDRLYVATTRGGWASPDPEDQDALSTALHGFDVTAADRTTYVASGDVPGYLLGRWALSARDGYLRVATTRGDAWQGEGATPSDSAVTVLQEAGGELTKVGEVTGLGVGEQIRAVRWFDDQAVVVTFRQTDPLYVVDLADPAAPVLRGELKVPGYSGYLHPIGDGRLLGVGQDATDTGQTLGVQVSSFDLTDPTAPTRLDVLTEADTWSDVEGDSRTFSYLPDRRVALLPISGNDGPSLRAVHVDADGSLSQVGTYAPESGPEGAWSYLQRAVPVGGDRVAVLLQVDTGLQLTMLGLDDLAVSGSTDL